MSDTDKNHKTILITGASSGIGEALARHYAGFGHRLILTGRNKTRLISVAKDCKKRGAEDTTGKVIDVTDRDAMARWIKNIDKKHAIDLVIANAGISGGTGSAPDGETPAQVKQIFDINVQGVFNTIDPVLPLMKRRGSGQIAIMSSLASFSGWSGAPAYSASKAAVRIYGEALRGTYRNQHIKINVICPGFVKSRMTAVNDYPMPFLMSAEKAASIVASGLAKNKPRIAFPWRSYALAWIIHLLPLRFTGWFFSKLPEKS